MPKQIHLLYCVNPRSGDLELHGAVSTKRRAYEWASEMNMGRVVSLNLNQISEALIEPWSGTKEKQ